MLGELRRSCDVTHKLTPDVYEISIQFLGGVPILQSIHHNRYQKQPEIKATKKKKKERKRTK